jgi:hypothetical protein
MDEMPDDPPEKPKDVLLLHSRTEDGEGMRGIRSRRDNLEWAELRPVRQGKPIGKAELVRLHPRPESPLLLDVEVQYAPEEASAAAHEGPARVTSNAYRRNWDEVFGGPGEDSTNSSPRPRSKWPVN